MAITIRRSEHGGQPALSDILTIDPALLEHPSARLAHHRGLLRVKAEALRDAERLAGWSRPLLVGVQMVSFLHLWHQIAGIAPRGTPALPLPAWAHWCTAALLTASVDATALYLLATRSAAQYARLGDRGRWAVWFFYTLTAALNSVFILSYTPGLPEPVAAITPALSLISAILLGLLIPVSLAAVEGARQVVHVARQILTVEVERLRGVLEAGIANDSPASPRASSSLCASIDAPAARPVLPTGIGIDAIAEHPAETQPVPVADRACPRCQTPLNAAQYGAARRWGSCYACRESPRRATLSAEAPGVVTATPSPTHTDQ